MKFRPCIDLHNGKVKQIVGATLSDNESTIKTNYESEFKSSYYAKLYKKDNLVGGHVIMLGPNNTDAALTALSTYPGGLQIGGGITTENAKKFLDAGASHIIVTSFVFKNGEINWHNLDALRNKIGSENIVLDLSCKRKNGVPFVVTDRWQNFTTFEITKQNIEKLQNYCNEFLVHAADVEGKQSGIDSELVSLLSNSTEVPITYAGGIRSLEDFELIKRVGHNKIDATVGSALDIFGGDLKYQDVVNWAQKN